MPNLEFTLTFKLPHRAKASEAYLDALHMAGCDDALIGIDRSGYIVLDFDRKASDPDVAVATAIDNVLAAIPGTVLTEVRPDIIASVLP